MHLHAIVQLQSLAVHGPSVRDLGPTGLHKLKELALATLRLIRKREARPLVLIALAPFVFWLLKRWIDRWEDRRRREDARRCAVDVAVTLAKSIQLCENVRVALQTAEPVADDTIETAIEALDHSRRTLRRYLSRHIPLHELIPLAVAAERRLGEGHQAMLTLHDQPDGAQPDPLYARRLQSVRAELQVTVDGLRRLEPDLGRAIAKVDAGWALSD